MIKSSCALRAPKANAQAISPDLLHALRAVRSCTSSSRAVECIRGSILREPACAMTYMRGKGSLHIQVLSKDEEFTIRDPVNTSIKFLRKGSTFSRTVVLMVP